jgi:hypothetical protein
MKTARIMQKDKRRALSPSRLPCIGPVHTLNVYSLVRRDDLAVIPRSLPCLEVGADVVIYRNLPDLLDRELDSLDTSARRRVVIIGASADPFAPIPGVAALTEEVLTRLFAHGVHIAFTTRHIIPPAIALLLQAHRHLVHGEVAVSSAQQRVEEEWEGHLPRTRERLTQVERLTARGIPMAVRVEPLIPFVNDAPSSLHELMTLIETHLVSRTSLTHLFIHPFMVPYIRRTLSRTTAAFLLGMFRSALRGASPTSRKPVLLPRSTRELGIARAVAAGRRVGVDVHPCACRNPDITREPCRTSLGQPEEPSRYVEDQLSLFAPAHTL